MNYLNYTYEIYYINANIIQLGSNTPQDFPELTWIKFNAGFTEMAINNHQDVWIIFRSSDLKSFHNKKFIRYIFPKTSIILSQNKMPGSIPFAVLTVPFSEISQINFEGLIISDQGQNLILTIKPQNIVIQNQPDWLEKSEEEFRSIRLHINPRLV